MALPPPSVGSTCLITGASSGIGADIARELASRGYGLTLVARREDRLRSLAEKLHAEYDVKAEVLPADLSDARARKELWTAIQDLGIAVEVLVNNAGYSTVGAVATAGRDRELGMIRTNVEAVVDLCTLAVPGMVQRGRGAVLNVASTAAFQPVPGQAGYAASKSFVLNYSWALGAELVGTGVTVTALCPGFTRTEFFAATGVDPSITARIPRRLIASPASVALAAVNGMRASQPIVLPGLINRLGAIGGQLTPRRVLMPIMARVYPATKA
jgi:short-subunit dehydrogenase